MSEARLASGLWVSAWLRRCDLAARPAYVVRRGDETAGAVMVKCAIRGGQASLWSRQWDYQTDTSPWVLRDQGAEADIDAIARREAAADPDLWLLETEATDGDPLLDQM